MAEYIEREKLLEELEKAPAYFDSGDTRYGIEIAIDQTKKQPTVDVVKVVRCKDCINFSEYHERYKPKVENADGDCFYRLIHSCDKQFCEVKYDDYCSYGERKGKE